MSGVRFVQVGLGVGLLVLLVATLWSVWWMAGQRAAALRESSSLARSLVLVDRIAALRAEPAIASAEDVGVQALGVQVESAMSAAGIEARRLEGIFPQASRRLTGLPYEMKPTMLSLRGVELRRLMVFLDRLRRQPGLNVRELDLTAARGEGASGLWDFQTTLTYLIFAPDGEGR
ncbi:hypothetical protein [Mucisphaera sp.]|uniref:hypothetical protein n=1 Tax=Mucisphaera sp. TaxID=2913024 RepID=UPI003D149533